ncbi:hypothetical protein WJX81_003482 [Elliptochloris bilobata]|uniref:Uncharacterized protein n=1 Tax=Elliptochloris bilobata TaxID=381761 RepID=A0AAW1RL16_9CHLO
MAQAAPSERPERAERLGWLTESSVQPRKRRAIEGVGTAGLVDLQATLYRQEEQARLVREGVLDPADTSGRRKAGIDVSAFARRNAGVEARDKRDKAHLQTPESQLEASRSALERKAQLYERLAAGSVADDDDEDLYNVDFVRKEARGDGEAARAGVATDGRGLDGRGEDAAHERRQRDWEAGEQRTLASELAAEEAQRERIQAVEDAEAATAAGRQRAAAAKERREATAARQREQLKTAFLKRQLAALKAAKKPPLKPA